MPTDWRRRLLAHLIVKRSIVINRMKATRPSANRNDIGKGGVMLLRCSRGRLHLFTHIFSIQVCLFAIEHMSYGRPFETIIETGVVHFVRLLRGQYPIRIRIAILHDSVHSSK